MDSIFISPRKRRLLLGFCVHRPMKFWGLPGVIDTTAGADMRPYLNE